MNEKPLNHSRYPTAQQSPGFLLWQASLVLRRKLEAALALHDLTQIQFALLACTWYLTQHDAVASQNNIAEFSRCDVTMTSQVLRTLERKGLITRQQIAGDKRSKYPTMTAAGHTKLNAAMKVVEAIDEQFFNHLGNKREMVMQGLEVLANL